MIGPQAIGDPNSTFTTKQNIGGNRSKYCVTDWIIYFSWIESEQAVYTRR